MEAKNGNYIAHFCYYKIIDLKSNKQTKKNKRKFGKQK